MEKEPISQVGFPCWIRRQRRNGRTAKLAVPLVDTAKPAHPLPPLGCMLQADPARWRNPCGRPGAYRFEEAGLRISTRFVPFRIDVPSGDAPALRAAPQPEGGRAASRSRSSLLQNDCGWCGSSRMKASPVVVRSRDKGRGTPARRFGFEDGRRECIRAGARYFCLYDRSYGARVRSAESGRSRRWSCRRSFQRYISPLNIVSGVQARELYGN